MNAEEANYVLHRVKGIYKAMLLEGKAVKGLRSAGFQGVSSLRREGLKIKANHS